MELVEQKKVAGYGGLLKLTTIFGLPFLFLLFVIGVAIVVSIITLNSNNQVPTGPVNVSEDVLRYEPVVRQFAKENGIEQYTSIILAIMQQESGGRGSDPLQSSESVGLPPGTIQDPILSIKYGVIHFKSVINKANGDIKLALQSYNFGGGFIDFVSKRGGQYTLELTKEFSKLQAQKQGWTCSDWQTVPYCYGDIGYVDKVLAYAGSTAPGGGGSKDQPNIYGYIFPMSNREVTSPFGMRIHPITGIPRFHSGVDFSCGKQAIPVYSVKQGIVSKTGWQDPNNHKSGYGQRVYVDHGNGQVSVYAHLSQIGVKVGQSVQQGQPIGNCGTTGSSTGMHLHFEIRLNDNQIDPLPYLKGA